MVDPLFACGGKRIKKAVLPSFWLAEERDVERSNDRVSKIEAVVALIQLIQFK
jgi:hypothetical protein